MPSATFESTQAAKAAATYSVPQKRIVSIEHPCIIKNFDNGFKSLGGEQQLKHVIENEVGAHKEPIAVASLRPHDPFAKKLASTASKSHNLILKVTVPKRTGRKRKRGSDEPYEDAPAGESYSGNAIDGPALLGRLRDAPNDYQVEVVGTVETTHRFQSLPDLQLRADDLPVMRNLRDRTMGMDYDQMKKWDLGNLPNAISAFPAPPSFTTIGQPYKYEYRQSHPSGNVPIVRHRSTNKRGWSMLDMGIPLDGLDPIPEGPPLKGPPRGKTVVRALAALKQLLEQRPCITLRAATQILKGHAMKSISYATQYVGYYVNKGPWDNCIIRYGVDPRKDPGCRFYQTLCFQFFNPTETNTYLQQQGFIGPGHVFDGKTLNHIGQAWQLCDLTDPVLQRLTNEPDIRDKCDIKKWGWYHNGTMGKIRGIVRHKMMSVLTQQPGFSNTEYDLLAALPNRVLQESDCRLAQSPNREVRRLAAKFASEAIPGPFKSTRMMRQQISGVHKSAPGYIEHESVDSEGEENDGEASEEGDQAAPEQDEGADDEVDGQSDVDEDDMEPDADQAGD